VNPRQRSALTEPILFLIALAWFWFWRPYGFYGGDSEYLDRQISDGLWFRKREPLAVAAMQISYQMVHPLLGWPPGWGISLVSCLAGAVAIVLLWRLCRDGDRPRLTFFLTLASGYLLLFHGSIEAYALPTCLLALWILAVHRVEQGMWPGSSIPLAFAGMAWCHTMAFCLSPALLLSAWFHRKGIGAEWKNWLMAGMLLVGLYVFTDVLQIGHGPGFTHRPALITLGGPEEWGPLFSAKHFAIKAHFLWVGLHVTLPFALMWVCKKWRSREDLQIAALAVSGLAFLVYFHPDSGYLDWDLFLLPSLPVAVLGARWVASSSKPTIWTTVWLAGFLLIWIPRVPVWVQLEERGLGEVFLSDFTEEHRFQLDDRFELTAPTLRVQGGWHTVNRRVSGSRTQWKAFHVVPGEKVNVPPFGAVVPIPDYRGPR
jgi:hypothetical protein